MRLMTYFVKVFDLYLRSAIFYTTITLLAHHKFHFKHILDKNSDSQQFLVHALSRTSEFFMHTYCSYKLNISILLTPLNIYIS